MEGSGVGIVLHGCVVHVDVHGEVMHVVGGCNLIATEHGRCLVYRSCGVHEQCCVCMAC